MKNSDEVWTYKELYGFMIAAFLFGLFIMLLATNISDNRQIEQLAQSICDQEYNMDFDSYDDGELTCKPKVIVEQEQYDGIVINIKEVR